MSLQFNTLKDIIDKQFPEHKDALALQIKRDGKYQKTTYAELKKAIKGLAYSLYANGLKKGDRVAILSENRPEWAIAYLTTIWLGAIAVPLDAMLKSEEIFNLIRASGSKFIFVSDKNLDNLKQIWRRLPTLQKIISFDPQPQSGMILSFENLREVGTQSITSGKRFDFPGVYPNDLAAIVYTSGTTGNPKGVMLSHRNIASNINAGIRVFEIGPKDNFLSVLPLHHTFETTAGFLAPLSVGSSITYAESLKSYKIMEGLQETRVTIMLGVPLLYQLFYEGILRQIESSKKTTKILFNIFFKLTKFVKEKIKIGLGKMFFGKVHRTFGGHIRFLVSGGAAINPQIIEFFDILGLPIIQGYGLTESSPILCANPLRKNKFGSVGPALPGVEIKIINSNASGVGEIIAKGPNIMQGYYKNEEATAEILNEGWLYTGDLGYKDEDGYVFITGRLKDVIVSGSGINIYPDEIESYLSKISYIKEVCVVGSKIKEGVRKDMEEVHAVIFPDSEYFEKEFGKKNVNPELIKNTLQQEIRHINPNIAEYKRIATFSIKDQEFTKTSLKKIRRFLVRKEVEGMEKVRV